MADPRYEQMRNSVRTRVANVGGGDDLVNKAVSEIDAQEAADTKPPSLEQTNAAELQTRYDAGSNLTQDQLAAKSLEGTDTAAAGLLPSEADLQRQSGTLGMSLDPATAHALQNRSSAIYDQSQADLGRSARLKAPDTMFQRSTQNRQMKQAESKIAQDVYKQQYQKYVDEKKARAGILGTLLSIGGTILGGILTGGASVAVQGAASAAGGAAAGAAGEALSGNSYSGPANKTLA